MKLIIQATPRVLTIETVAHFQDLLSLFMVAAVAMQGRYSSENIINDNVFAFVKCGSFESFSARSV